MSTHVANEYIMEYGDTAVDHLVADLMRDQPAIFKRGYSRENAIIAAAEAFGVTTAEIEEQLA